MTAACVRWIDSSAPTKPSTASSRRTRFTPPAGAPGSARDHDWNEGQNRRREFAPLIVAAQGRIMLLLDAGALIAVERADREVIALLKRERLAGRSPLTHGGIIGQVWRGGTGRRPAWRSCSRASTCGPWMTTSGDVSAFCCDEPRRAT